MSGGAADGFPVRAGRQRQKEVVGGLEVRSEKIRFEVERHVSPHERVVFCLRGCLSHSLVAL